MNLLERIHRTHPWLNFELEINKFPPRFWINLGECVSKCHHLGRVATSDALRQHIHQIYLTQGALATTAIEGNTLSEAEVENIIIGKANELPIAYQAMETEVRNVVNLFNDILRAAKDAPLAPLSPNLICDFQRKILHDLAIEGNIGRLRQRSVVVGNYRGAPYEICDGLLTRLCDWIKEDSAGFLWLQKTIGKTSTCIIRAILTHLYIAWIHPFDDGNGRTARMVEFYLLVAADIPPAAAHLLATHCNMLRDQYYQQLAQASITRSPINFIGFMVAGLRDGLRQQLQLVYTEHEELAWHAVMQKKIIGSQKARQRRLKLSHHLLSQTATFTASKLLTDDKIAILYAKTEQAEALLNADLAHLAKIEILIKNGGYRINKQLISGMLSLQA